MIWLENTHHPTSIWLQFRNRELNIQLYNANDAHETTHVYRYLPETLTHLEFCFVCIIIVHSYLPTHILFRLCCGYVPARSVCNWHTYRRIRFRLSGINATYTRHRKYYFHAIAYFIGVQQPSYIDFRATNVPIARLFSSQKSY